MKGDKTYGNIYGGLGNCIHSVLHNSRSHLDILLKRASDTVKHRKRPYRKCGRFRRFCVKAQQSKMITERTSPTCCPTGNTRSRPFTRTAGTSLWQRRKSSPRTPATRTARHPTAPPRTAVAERPRPTITRTQALSGGDRLRAGACGTCSGETQEQGKLSIYTLKSDHLYGRSVFLF